MKLAVLAYQCDNCGLCCTRTLVRATTTDAQRQPLILKQRRLKREDGTITNDYLLNRNPGDPGGEQCVFHTGTCCGIYATRPQVCVGFQAGGKDCQELRRIEGLPPLVPVPQEIEEDYAIVSVERADLPTDAAPDTLGRPQDGATAVRPALEPSNAGLS